jgi:hypothetical protein
MEGNTMDMRETLRRNPHANKAARLTALAIAFVAAPCTHLAQLPAQPIQPNAAIVPGAGAQNPLFAGGNQGNNNTGRGGGQNADFESLIDLIMSTVATDTWAENGGGGGDIRPFFGGVFVDAGGTLHLNKQEDSSLKAAELSRKRGTPLGQRSGAQQKDNARTPSQLRYVSLPRLEREIARRQAAREPLDAAMLTLAGLQRAKFVFVYPETGDLVLAGPAGDWFVDPAGRILSTEHRQPVVRLDDLLVLLRRGADAVDSQFGCSINPRQTALAKTQAFLASTSTKPLQPGQRKKWLGDLRDSVGKQDIEIFGIDPASRAAAVLVEADYHMKLIGMGLVEGVDGMESYLDSLKSEMQRGGESSPPAMSVLRWWFSLDYDSIGKSENHDSFELIGRGSKVLSENELLAAQGQRVPTGTSDFLNRQFAEEFTAQFRELAREYPVYGELRNIFDLALAVALIQSEGLAERVGWKPGLLVSRDHLRLPQGAVPREVDTVINHRVINQRHIVAGVSGGVMVAPGDVLKATRATDSADKAIARPAVPPKDLASGAWWWDATE